MGLQLFAAVPRSAIAPYFVRSPEIRLVQAKTESQSQFPSDADNNRPRFGARRLNFFVLSCRLHHFLNFPSTQCSFSLFLNRKGCRRKQYPRRTVGHSPTSSSAPSERGLRSRSVPKTLVFTRVAFFWRANRFGSESRLTLIQDA